MPEEAVKELCKNASNEGSNQPSLQEHDHRVDHDPVTGQAVLDDSWGSGPGTTKEAVRPRQIVTTKRRALGAL